jgi:hypothetical protein
LHRSAAGPSLAPGCVVRALSRYYAPLRLPLGGSRPAQEGLSSSVHDSPCIPRPLRRGVLGGCVSQVFPTSMGLRLMGPGSAPPCPLPSEEYNGAADFALCCGLQVCSASFRGLCQRALTPASRPAQAGAWDFVAAQLLGGWGLTETGLSPASHARLFWTHSQGYLTIIGCANGGLRRRATAGIADTDDCTAPDGALPGTPSSLTRRVAPSEPPRQVAPLPNTHIRRRREWAGLPGSSTSPWDACLDPPGTSSRASERSSVIRRRAAECARE